ncbi:MAG: hypothetical protein Q9M13_05275 [Mariprofundales bacterium]|nr:hypothetical protein [Mariprofundales bacterium]
MRRCVALLLTFTLLAVSSLPALSDAATCAMPTDTSAELGSDRVTAAHDTRGTNQLHADQLHSSSDNHCYIECGCGCHPSLDTLPHLLAPSALQHITLLHAVTVTRAAPIAANPTEGRHLPLSTPPPIAS